MARTSKDEDENKDMEDSSAGRDDSGNLEEKPGSSAVNIGDGCVISLEKHADQCGCNFEGEHLRIVGRIMRGYFDCSICVREKACTYT